MISLLSVILFGFFLGMRHATDLDHVVAVATIVSRKRTLRTAAPIGIVWGLSHTATIAVVGVAIIFGLEIPPRLGLGMEFCVSLMLVALGGWNLWMFARDVRRLAGREASAAPAQPAHEHASIEPLDRIAGSWRGYRLVRPLSSGSYTGSRVRPRSRSSWSARSEIPSGRSSTSWCLASASSRACS